MQNISAIQSILRQNAVYLQFVRAVIRSKSIPFSIKAKEEDEVTAKAREAFQNMCDAARANNVNMTLDEINAEIREVRRLRKERNGVCSY